MRYFTEKPLLSDTTKSWQPEEFKAEICAISVDFSTLITFFVTRKADKSYKITRSDWKFQKKSSNSGISLVDLKALFYLKND